MRRSLASVLRKAQPWIVGWLTFQAVVALAGWLAAWRKDEGDENSASIRRVLTHNGLELRPRSAQLSRVRVDLAMAGAEIDLTGLPRPQTGIDVTVIALMGGVAIRVPVGWRAWWSFRGAMGGVGADKGIERVADPTEAVVRVHARALMGGVGIETPKT